MTLVAMKRADGEIDSEVHVDGLVLKPGDNGIVWIPGPHVFSLMGAGYIAVGVTNARPTGNPAPLNE